MSGRCCRASQRGFVLIVSLLVLLLLGIIATTVARTNRLQLHMAGNDEGRVAALQQALAVVDAVLDSPAAISLDSSVGHMNCMAGSPDPACDEYTLELAPGALPESGDLALAVTRVAPAESAMPVMEEAMASSAVHYRVAKFEVQVTYDGTTAGVGRASLAQGVLVRLPVSTQSGGGAP
jgi:Tfp pilus assembly protein PilX